LLHQRQVIRKVFRCFKAWRHHQLGLGVEIDRACTFARQDQRIALHQLEKFGRQHHAAPRVDQAVQIALADRVQPRPAGRP